MYKPLPEELYIRRSAIEGMGIFAKKDIDGNVNLGLIHIVLNHDPKENDDEIIRTPLGGFINHSDEPNCIKVKEGNRYSLFTLRDIKAEEEITLKYTLYKI